MTIFSRIIAGEIPSYKIVEDEQFCAFLDAFPVQPGHTLIVPKREVDYIFDLTDEELAAMMAFAKKVAAAIKTATQCRKVAITVIGLEVPHAHIHLVPITNEGDLDFGKKNMSPQAEEQAKIAEAIQAHLS